MDTIKNKDKSMRYQAFFFWAVVVDILFLPYIPIINITFSMLLIPTWYLLNIHRIKIKINDEFYFFMCFMFFSVLSILMSITTHYNFLSQNLISFVIITLGFILYFYLKNMQYIFFRSIDNILILYVCFIGLLALIYFVSPSSYFFIRSFWSQGNADVGVSDSLLISRFTGTLSDPNNVASMINAVFLFLLYKSEIRQLYKFLLLILVGFITVCTLSTTGIILYVTSMSFFVIQLLMTNKIKLKYSIKAVIKILITISLILIMLYYAIPLFFNSDLYNAFLFRTESNSADSRLSRWKTVLENKNIIYYLLSGDGGTIFVNHKSFRPHNGHLYLIYNYGAIAYISFLYIFFRVKDFVYKKNIKNYIFLIPFFVGFTVNVGINDVRYLSMLSLLVAVSAVQNKKMIE